MVITYSIIKNCCILRFEIKYNSIFYEIEFQFKKVHDTFTTKDVIHLSLNFPSFMGIFHNKEKFSSALGLICWLYKIENISFLEGKRLMKKCGPETQPVCAIFFPYSFLKAHIRWICLTQKKIHLSHKRSYYTIQCCFLQ